MKSNFCVRYNCVFKVIIMEEFSFIHFDESYELISLTESLLMNSGHAAHCCIFSPNSFSLGELSKSSYECKAYISMQMRFDGCLGFHGGYVSRNSVNNHDIVDGLNRELVEEINLDKKYFVTQNNYCFTCRHKENNGCFHFFSKEVPVEDFLEIERNSLTAEDFGKEVLGFLRVPLFTMADKIRGFPKFLSNKFVGYAKYQLLYTVLNKKLASLDYVKESFSKSQSL